MAQLTFSNQMLPEVIDKKGESLPEVSTKNELG